jgi:hypothetical protein
MAKSKKVAQRKILMPYVKSKIPLEEIKRAVREVADARRRAEAAKQSKRKTGP